MFKYSQHDHHLDANTVLSNTKHLLMLRTQSKFHILKAVQLFPWECFAQTSHFFSGGNVETINGVQIGPGATALTLMFFSANWPAKERVKAVIAPLVEE